MARRRDKYDVPTEKSSAVPTAKKTRFEHTGFTSSFNSSGFVFFSFFLVFFCFNELLYSVGTIGLVSMFGDVARVLGYDG